MHSLPPTMDAMIEFPLDDLAAHVAASCAIQPAGDATKTRRFEARTGTTCLIKCMACSRGLRYGRGHLRLWYTGQLSVCTSLWSQKLDLSPLTNLLGVYVESCVSELCHRRR